MSRKWATGTIAIPAPAEVYRLMRKVPKDKVTSINEIRQALPPNIMLQLVAP